MQLGDKTFEQYVEWHTPKAKEDISLTLSAPSKGGEGIGVAHAVALAGKSIGRNENDTNGLRVSDNGVQYTLTGADQTRSRS